MSDGHRLSAPAHGEPMHGGPMFDGPAIRSPGRFRLWRLWLVHSYRFRWAHKPLCGRFAEDILKVGEMRICRSCLCAWLGVAAGLVAVVVSATVPAFGGFPLSGLAFAAVLFPVLGLSLPTIYKKLPRTIRDVLRFAGGALIPSSVGVAFTHPLLGLAALVAMFLFWKVYFRLRKTRRLSACEGCPDRVIDGICPGFALQAEGARAFERAASERVMENSDRCYFSG